MALELGKPLLPVVFGFRAYPCFSVIVTYEEGGMKKKMTPQIKISAQRVYLRFMVHTSFKGSRFRIASTVPSWNKPDLSRFLQIWVVKWRGFLVFSRA